MYTLRNYRAVAALLHTERTGQCALPMDASDAVNQNHNNKHAHASAFPPSMVTEIWIFSEGFMPDERSCCIGERLRNRVNLQIPPIEKHPVIRE